MTLVSDDPSWLPTINFFYLSSYFVGTWRPSCMMMVVSRSNLGFCVAVVASVMVIYDWGEQSSTHWKTTDILIISLSPVLTLGREVGWSHHRSRHLTQNRIIGWTGLGEQSPISEDNRMMRLIWSRGSVYLSWPFYISVYVAWVMNVDKLCWCQTILDALYRNNICYVCLKLTLWHR